VLQALVDCHLVRPNRGRSVIAEDLLGFLLLIRRPDAHQQSEFAGDQLSFEVPDVLSCKHTCELGPKEAAGSHSADGRRDAGPYQSSIRFDDEPGGCGAAGEDRDGENEPADQYKVLAGDKGLPPRA
jgi:hypothetical protein